LIFVLFGLGTGSLTALVALGVLVVYRSSGVINFSASAVGAVGAYACYSLRDNHGVPTVLAVVAGLLVGALLGLLTHGAMALLREASLLVRLIATLGLFSSAQAFVLIVWGSNVTVPKPFLPTKRISIGSAAIGVDRLLLILIALVLAGVLVFVYSRTIFGLATSAVSESRRFSAASGWSTSLIEAANHVIAGVLAAAAAILLAPVIGLSAVAFAAVILPALAAALVGRFTSFPLTLVAALLIGIAQSELSLYEGDIAKALGVSALSLSGMPSAVPLLVIVLLTIARGSSQVQRGETQARLPMPGSGLVSLLPLVLGLAFAAAVLTKDSSWGDPLIAMAAAGILLLSVVLLSGYAGQLSLSQFALAGMGGWVAARLSQAAHPPFLISLVVGVLAAVGIGLLVALPALRARGISLAIATLALALLLNSLIFTNSSLTGGYNGVTVDTPSIFGYNLDPIQYPVRYAGLGLVLFVVAGLVVANLRRGSTGRRLLAIREDERAAASLGVGVYGAKLFAFAVSAALAGAAGVYLSFQFPSAQFTNYDAASNVSVVQNSVLGGLGWVSGTPIGALISSGSVLSHAVTLKLSSIDKVDSWVTLIAGLALILVLRGAPDGIAAVWARAFGSSGADRRRTALSLPVPLWRALGLLDAAVGVGLVVAVVDDAVLQPMTWVALVLVAAELVAAVRARDRVAEWIALAIQLVLVVGLLVLGVSSPLIAASTTGGEIYRFIASQILGIALLTLGTAKLSGRIVRLLRFPRSRPPRPETTSAAAEPMTVELRNVTMRFGGVVALDDVSLTLRPGEVVGLMGPNGAGKTTLLDIATGFTRPTEGTLLVDGEDAGGWGATTRARKGLVRSWQSVELFDSMTIRDNLLVAADTKAWTRYFKDLFHPGRPRSTAALDAAVEKFGLQDVLDRRPSELSQGTTRLVGMVRAVVAQPRALLLDEPAAGLDQAESTQLATAIRDIAETSGIPVLVVEHDVPMMMSLCDRLVVLDFGRLIAEGTPAEIAANPLVLEAYLGSDQLEKDLDESVRVTS
jgi:sulfate-transporting ATPase